MAEILPPIAVALRTARARAAISQYDLARLSGVARITIANIEGGKHPTVRTGTAEKLAGCLGLTSARYLHVALKTVQGLAQRGEIPCRKVGKAYKFYRPAVLAWLLGANKAGRRGHDERQAPGILSVGLRRRR